MKFFKKYKKILIALALLAFIIIAGFLIWITFFKPVIFPESEIENEINQGGLPIADEGSGISEDEDEKEPGQLPEEGEKEEDIRPEDFLTDDSIFPVASGGLTKVESFYDNPTIGMTLSKNGDGIQYYDYKSGKFYSQDANGNKTLLSERSFYEVENVTWSPQKNNVVIEYPDGSNIVYNFDTEEQVTLPKHWEDFEFSQDGNNIVSKSISATNSDNNYLIIAGVDGSNVRALEYIGDNYNKVYPSWSPNNQIAAMYSRSTDYNRQELFFIGLNDENFKSTTIEGRGFIPEWSKDGDKLLYSVYNSQGNLMPELWIVNSEGDNIGTDRKKLNLQTWADKCTFSDNRYAYCAVPKELPEAAGLFPDLAADSEDNLYKIDTLTGISSLVAIPDGYYNMKNLNISEDGKYLYFSESEEGDVYKIQLK
ncbi:hypothetical protein EOL94_04010 [bacterium]|nr:hypothetical protein [bacterium]